MADLSVMTSYIFENEVTCRFSLQINGDLAIGVVSDPLSVGRDAGVDGRVARVTIAVSS